MRSSYTKEDVTILLKDISGQIEGLSTNERESLIQAGKHYSEMLPIEYIPSSQYMDIYFKALEDYSQLTADAVMTVAEKIYKKFNGNFTLVSLARAGTPIGILLKHYIKFKYNVDIPHYTISIIRDKGIDKNAINYILNKHKANTLQFVDGWIGKGAICRELKKELQVFPNVSNELAVLSDPAGITNIYGTKEDFLIPSSCLNSTVSGLISRTILNNSYIGAEDFHGAVYYENLISEDLSYHFIKKIEQHFSKDIKIINDKKSSTISGLDEVKQISEFFDISDINFVKPGIGETTRVLLRRKPDKILVKSELSSDCLEHIYKLAEEKNVQIVKYPLQNYLACGIIKKIKDI